MGQGTVACALAARRRFDASCPDAARAGAVGRSAGDAERWGPSLSVPRLGIHRGSADRAGAYPDAGPADLGAVRWRLACAGAYAPVVTPGRALFAAADGGLYSVDVASGELRWRVAAGDFIEGTTPVVVGAVAVVGTRDRGIYGLDAETGQERWRTRSASWTGGSPVAHGGVVYTTTEDALLALDPATGREIWRVAGQNASSAPALADGRAFFVANPAGDAPGMLRAVDARGGELLWQREVPSWAVACPVAVAELVLVGDVAGGVSAFDAQTGEPRWVWPRADEPDAGTPADGVHELAVGAGCVLVPRGAGRMVALDPATGSRRWTRELEGEFVTGAAVAGPTAFVGSAASLSALDAATGARRGVLTLACSAWAPVVAGDLLLVGSDEGLAAVGAALAP